MFSLTCPPDPIFCSVYRLALEWARLVNDDRDGRSYKP